MTRTFRAAVCGVIAAPFLFYSSANATTATFENIAPQPIGLTSFLDDTVPSNGYDFYMTQGFIVSHGYAVDSSFVTNNGTDYLIHDSPFNLVVTNAAASQFSFRQVDFGTVVRPIEVSVTGYVFGGGVLNTTITGNGDFQTQQFSGWDNLIRLEFSGTNLGAYDNFVFNEVSAVPIPAALSLFAGGLGLMVLLARKRKRDAAPK